MSSRAIACRRAPCLAAAYLAIAAAGCATAVTMASMPYAERQSLQTRQYDEADSTILSAAVDAMADMGYSLRLTDHSSGLIQTDALNYAPNPDQDALAMALIGYAPRFCRSVTIHISRGTVRLNINWQKTDRYGWQPYDPPQNIGRQEYETHFSWIDSKLSGLQ
jgi:hypothetical protein